MMMHNRYILLEYLLIESTKISSIRFGASRSAGCIILTSTCVRDRAFFWTELGMYSFPIISPMDQAMSDRLNIRNVPVPLSMYNYNT